MKKIDAVKMFRDIRDKLNKQTKKMTSKEIIEFYQKQSAEFRAGLGKQRSLIKAH